MRRGKHTINSVISSETREPSAKNQTRKWASVKTSTYANETYDVQKARVDGNPKYSAKFQSSCLQGRTYERPRFATPIREVVS